MVIPSNMVGFDPSPYVVSMDWLWENLRRKPRCLSHKKHGENPVSIWTTIDFTIEYGVTIDFTIEYGVTIDFAIEYGVTIDFAIVTIDFPIKYGPTIDFPIKFNGVFM